MPIHDWTHVDSGIFHDFHQAWIIGIRDALNAGLLPEGYFAMAEQVVGGPIPDVIALQRWTRPPFGEKNGDKSGGVAVVDAPPKASIVTIADPDRYVAKANIISIQHGLGNVVAVIEIVSPGNKSGRVALRRLIEKAEQMIRGGVNLLVIDLFPPSNFDPQGIHKAIWDLIIDESFHPPEGKPLTVASYVAGEAKTAYVEPLAVGDVLPSLPIFLEEDRYVPAPLETTYQSTWDKCPAIVRELIAAPAR